MKNKFVVPALCVFFLLTAESYFSNLYSYSTICNGWIIGDWLINFESGFVRRGLSGYLLLGLSDLLGAKPNFVVTGVQMTLYIAYMFLFFFLIYKKKITFWFLLMALSPAVLLFPIRIASASGRKEIILFFLFALYILCLNRKLFKSHLIIFLFSISLLIATLFHELIFFYTPYFLLATFLKFKIDREQFPASKALFVVSGSFLATIILFLFGKNINGSVICSGLMARGLPENICKGILAWPAKYSIKDALFYAKENNYILVYCEAICLGIIPFFLFTKELKNKLFTQKMFLVTVLLFFLFSSPMFILSIDWGRWINIHLVLLLFTSTLLLDNKSPKTSEEYLAIPRLWKSETPLSEFASNAVLLILCIFYLTVWVMNHYGGHPIFSLHFYDVFYSKIHSLVM